MTDHPPIPDDCDLRDFAFMPLDVLRLRDSGLAVESTGDEFRAAVLLWCAAWHQVPAGSLPDDDRALCNYAGCGRDARTWKRLRDGALRGWILNGNGRLYHPVITEKALEAWAAKTAQRERTAAARAASIMSRKVCRESVTPCVTDCVTQTVTASKGQGQGHGQGQGQGNPLSPSAQGWDNPTLKGTYKGQDGTEQGERDGILGLCDKIRSARPEYARLREDDIAAELHKAQGCNGKLADAVRAWAADHANMGEPYNNPLASVRKMVERLVSPPEARRGRWDGKLEPSKVKCRE